MLPFQLNRDILFVDLVFRLIKGEKVLEEAIDCLERAERQCRLQIWYHPDNVLDGLRYLPINDEPIQIGKLYPQLFNSDLFYNAYKPVDVRGLQVQDAIQSQLYPFLSQTSCVIQGGSFTNDHFVIFSNAIVFSASQRFWGGILAEWANSIGWLKKNDWSYVDFYLDLASNIAQYNDWVNTALYVIKIKCKKALQQLDDEAS